MSFFKKIGVSLPNIWYFSNKRRSPKKLGSHSIGSTHTTLILQMSEKMQSEQIKSIPSFNCFIQPASPWIIYVAPPTIRFHSLPSCSATKISAVRTRSFFNYNELFVRNFQFLQKHLLHVIAHSSFNSK